MIHHAPQQATRALQTLLRDTEADSVLRFLDERPSLREELKIVFSTLPWGPFLKSALPALRHTPWAVEPPYGVYPALHEGAR
jgi:aspartyl/asparaginyl beta-hydroxylase (cupin superfamily)